VGWEKEYGDEPKYRIPYDEHTHNTQKVDVIRYEPETNAKYNHQPTRGDCQQYRKASSRRTDRRDITHGLGGKAIAGYEATG
jgi:hypothetical protein